MDEIQQVPMGEDAEGRPVMRRVMTAEQIKAREDMNVGVTASRLRARVLAQTNGRNGHAKLSTGQLGPL